MLADSVLSRYVCTVRGWLLMVVGNLIGAGSVLAGHQREFHRRDHRNARTSVCTSRNGELLPIRSRSIFRILLSGRCATLDVSGFSVDQGFQAQDRLAA
jgi:hypothetical protein